MKSHGKIQMVSRKEALLERPRLNNPLADAGLPTGKIKFTIPHP
jgi:hypothetical protein